MGSTLVDCLLLLLVINHALITAKPGKGTPLSDYIVHYEPLLYDKDTFHTAHHRSKRSTRHDLHLDFNAHGKHFKLRLKRDHQIFSPDLVVENSDGEISFDTTRAYTGHLEGEEGSSTVMGVVTDDGLFEGKISTDDGEQYVISPSKHHFSDQPQFHSVIYRHSDVHMPKLRDSACKSDEFHAKIRTIQKEHGGHRRHAHSHPASSEIKHFHTRLKKKPPGGQDSSHKHKRGHSDSNLDSAQHEMSHSSSVPEDRELDKDKSKHQDVHRENRNGVPEINDDSGSNLHESLSDDTSSEQQSAKHHKSAQLHHQYHSHHVHRPHKHQSSTPDMAAAPIAFKPSDQFLRLTKNEEEEDSGFYVEDGSSEVKVNDFLNGIRTHASSDVYSMNQFSKSEDDSVLSAKDVRDAYRRVSDNKQTDNHQEDPVVDNRDSAPSHHRQKRAMIDPSKITCSLYLQADHLFFQKFHSSEETVIEQLTQHVQGVNEIYKAIDFDGDAIEDNINFVIKRIKVHTEPRSPGYKFPGNYGVETYLELFSEDNFDAFCLAYMFTYRDFEGGTLGLAWTGDLQNAGGVCEKNGQFRGSLKSLNSGIVTILNYGKDVPSTVSHVTMAHEIGHNMGSQHDPETHECSPGGETGNFIMFARATSGDKPNNNKFSLCSQVSMALVMEAKARHTAGCFIAPTSSICGNEVVEPGEECDCGWEDECRDQCCFPQTSSGPTHHRPCTRTPGAICSPSEGPCCTSSCQLIGPYSNRTCRESSPCKAAAYCNGRSPICPMSRLRPDKTPCDDGYVCYQGECTGSICMAYELESCQCEPDDRSNFQHPDLCKLCCKFPGEGSPCRSSYEWNYPPFDVPDLQAKPGSPCNDYKGYCDVFHKCREVDPSGPLANLKRFFSGEGMASFREWLATYWYVVLAAGLLLLILLALVIRLCAPRKTKVPVTPIKTHEQITPVAHAPPLPTALYSNAALAAAQNNLMMNSSTKPLLLDNQYKHSASCVAPTTPPVRPSAPLLPSPTINKKLPFIRRPAPSPPSANRKLLISGNYPPGGKKLSQSEGWV